MGFLKKLMKKSIGHKLMKKDPVNKAIGLGGGKKTGGMGQKMAGAMSKMKTGGNAQATRTGPARPVAEGLMRRPLKKTQNRY